MSMYINFIRVFLILSTGLILGACTQSSTGTSSYTGHIKSHASSYTTRSGSKKAIQKAREAKIQAARKRARSRKQARLEAFRKKRFSKAGRTAKTNRSRSARNKKSRYKKARYKKKRSYRKRKTRVSSKRASRKKSTRRVASKRRSTKKRLKKSRNAYVGGRSKGISRNSKPWKCVPSRLKKVLRQISKKYGHVSINSTHRGRRHNRRVGGKRGSYHLRCRAVDFRVRGRTRGLTRWLARHPLVGGYKRYPSGYYHIDTGPKRTW